MYLYKQYNIYIYISRVISLDTYKYTKSCFSYTCKMICLYMFNFHIDII